jgi:hypothetical protein
MTKPVSEGFASRWARLKRERAAGVADPSPMAENSTDQALNVPTAQTAGTASDADAVVQALPPVETLTPESDYAAFMQPKVPDALKRQALKQLFRDPHFNQMDGLDVYIDDYSVSTPIPEDWYDAIPSWQAILNPKEAVITSKGYAVEPDSEEGKAILAERARAAAALAPEPSEARATTAAPEYRRLVTDAAQSQTVATEHPMAVPHAQNQPPKGAQ